MHLLFKGAPLRDVVPVPQQQIDHLQKITANLTWRFSQVTMRAVIVLDKTALSITQLLVSKYKKHINIIEALSATAK